MPEQVTVFTPPKSPPVNPAPAVVERNTAPVKTATSATVQSSPDITPAQARWKADQDALVKADPWRDPNVVMVKDPVTGIISARARTDGGVNGVPQPEGQPHPQGEPGPVGVDADGRLAIGDLRLSADDVRGLLERKGIEDSRRATMPKDAASYDAGLPPDFVTPAGVGEFRWSDDPVSVASLGQVKQLAFELGLDQSSFSKLVAVYAGHQVAEQARFNAAKAAEIAKLGSNAAARVDAISTFLHAKLGDELARALTGSMYTANAVKAYERLINVFVNGNVGGSPGAHRDGASSQPPRISDEEYSKLSYFEKQQYAQHFQQNGGGR
jgi:hypothetical protein